MDNSKEYIQLVDCPEIQDGWKVLPGDSYYSRYQLHGTIALKDSPKMIANIHEAVTIEDGGKENYLFIPSVSWLLREITLGINSWLRLETDGNKWQAGIDVWFGARGPVYKSGPCDSPDKALLHVFMWQKGKTWKAGEWVKR